MIGRRLLRWFFLSAVVSQSGTSEVNPGAATSGYMVAAPNVTVYGGPYSQAYRMGNMLFISGLIGLDTYGRMPYGVAEQTRQILRNLGSILAAGGLNIQNVGKVTVYLADMGHASYMDNAYFEYFKSPYPARTLVESRRLPMGASVEIDAIAMMPNA